jgi:hypothetical protein
VATTALFRLSGAGKREPVIEEWLNKTDALTTVARTWFKKMRACGEDVVELMHDGCPVACVEDVPFGYVNVFKSHTNVAGKNMRHVKVKPGRELDSAALQGLIHAAYLDVKIRLRTE